MLQARSGAHSLPTKKQIKIDVRQCHQEEEAATLEVHLFQDEETCDGRNFRSRGGTVAVVLGAVAGQAAHTLGTIFDCERLGAGGGRRSDSAHEPGGREVVRPVRPSVGLSQGTPKTERGRVPDFLGHSGPQFSVCTICLSWYGGDIEQRARMRTAQRAGSREPSFFTCAEVRKSKQFLHQRQRDTMDQE